MHEIDPKTIVWKKIEAEIVILNLGSGHYYTLKDAGVILWDSLLTRQTPEAIAEKVCAEYDVSPKTVLADINDCIKKMIHEGILTPPSKK